MRKLGEDFEKLMEEAKEIPGVKERSEKPFRKSREEILELADKWGIEYELNSDNPGFFVEDKDGVVRKVSIEDILFL